MSSTTERTASSDQDVFARLDQLGCFNGTSAQFWASYLDVGADLTGATIAVVLHREPSGSSPSWRLIAAKTGVDGTLAAAAGREFVRAAIDAAEGCLAAGCELRSLGPGSGTTPDGTAIMVRLLTGVPDEACIAAFLLPAASLDRARAAVPILRVTATLPCTYQAQRCLTQAKVDVGQFASVLDLMVLLNAETRFLAAAMTVCNELASRHRCDRVSLGWTDGEYVRLQAISHTEKFERKMAMARQIEAVMEEALDQDEEILWPAAAASTAVAREHETFCREHGTHFLCSVPVRVGAKVVGVVCAERSDAPFAAVDVGHLRLCADQTARRLADLKRRDRWFGARWSTATREGLASLVGVEHTWAKLGAVAVTAAVAVLVFGSMTYRVGAPFVLRADKAAYFPAPFDGYIGEVTARVGDAVRQGDVLLTLDTRDLLLEAATATAEQQRYRREAEKARAQNNLAEMQIAAALVEQARVRLELVRYRLDQSWVKAGFDGIVVEGDLRERVGAPVRQGETLYRVARLDSLYAELEVDEADIGDVQAAAHGELAFASQPQQKHPVAVVRIEPVAQPKAGRNAVLVRCEFAGPPGTWCRPGMSGIAKIHMGTRRIIWILTHRTVDFLRLRLWC